MKRQIDSNEHQTPDLAIIYKYPLALAAKQVIELPNDYVPLSIQLQNGALVLWAVVGEMTKKEYGGRQVSLEIEIVGTGRHLQGDVNGYFATVQQGPMVWHIFLKEVR